ncbi:ParM/StbA family protein [Peribacillus asahii]|uniref:ParM/StbA family protein n=1 Tax=Peribacillus asahii TaxID=228899 RepID=UPI002079EBE7|nr:ParM/StbA family protein [Peribacillus asahii]USK72623.1 ParM/StbA family protein [Peribacillus asahii]USK72739.1 ParM/StbA family protein [Peribacillus asahii]
MKFVLANDIGNDKMKIVEAGSQEVVKVPSAYRKLMRKPAVHENDVKKNVMNLIDQLVVHINSNSIRFPGIYMVGERAIQSTEDVRNMNIKVDQKHTSDLPLINTLAYVAARAVQMDFEERGVLENNLEIDVFMSSAIPASQHNVDTAKHLESRFMNGTHIVIVFVGKEAVTVKVTFKKVKVMKEGVPALYSIFEAPKDMFAEFVREYNLGDIDGSYFMESKNMHVDIGSGTTEYVYTKGLNPSNEQCTGERRGVGHAVQAAIELMADERNGLNINRQQFASIIERPEEYQKDHELAVECLKDARIIQVEAILTDIEEKYSTTLASEPEVITVYGGGSVEFRDDMYRHLKQYADSVNAKVLWIPQQYAVNMNARGLNILNENMFFEAEYQEIEG